MKRNNILKGAVVLLIAVALFLSTAVTAETIKETNETKIVNTSIKATNPNPQDPVIEPALGDVIFSQRYYEINEDWEFFRSSIDTGLRAADDYWGINQEICDIHWWGLSLIGNNPYYSCDPTDMQFEIIFWDNPSTPVCVYQFTPTVQPTGKFYMGFEMYYWEVDISPHCYLPNGWVSIQSIYSPAGCEFWWAGSPEGNLNAVQNWVPINPPDNLAFELTGECTSSIDVEKYVYDPVTTNWVDADTESTAQGILIDGTAEFRIIIHNDGECPLYNIGVLDTMLDGLTYISADPAFDDMTYDPPHWHFVWVFPGPLMPCNTIEICLTASVQGPEGSINFNSVEVIGFSEHGTSAIDDDWCYVHATKKSREVNTPFLNWLDNHPNMFPLLQLLLQRLGLQ